MLCYALFDPLPTHSSLLIEQIALVGFSAVGVLLLSVLVAGLLATLLLLILLPTYLLGLLQPALRKPALRLPNEFVPTKWGVPAVFNSGGGSVDLPIGVHATDYRTVDAFNTSAVVE